MKKYEKIKLIAKNSPSGSYAAGCSPKDIGYSADPWILGCEGKVDNCVKCERTH